MVRINIGKPISSVIYNGEVAVKGTLHYYFIMETVLKTEIHWLGLAPQNKKDIEDKIIKHLNKINDYGKNNA